MNEVGWSLAVGHRGEVVHTECTGPHTPATRFDIASTSKQFTGLAALLTLDCTTAAASPTTSSFSRRRATGTGT